MERLIRCQDYCATRGIPPDAKGRQLNTGPKAKSKQSHVVAKQSTRSQIGVIQKQKEWSPPDEN